MICVNCRDGEINSKKLISRFIKLCGIETAKSWSSLFINCRNILSSPSSLLSDPKLQDDLRKAVDSFNWPRCFSLFLWIVAWSLRSRTSSRRRNSYEFEGVLMCRKKTTKRRYALKENHWGIVEADKGLYGHSQEWIEAAKEGLVRFKEAG